MLKTHFLQDAPLSIEHKLRTSLIQYGSNYFIRSIKEYYKMRPLVARKREAIVKAGNTRPTRGTKIDGK